MATAWSKRVTISIGYERRARMVWSIVYPLLSLAIRYFDEIDSLPETRLIGADKKSRQRQIDQTIERLTHELSTSDAVNSRNHIKNLRELVRKSREQLAEYRACRISAPTDGSRPFFEGILEKGRESYDQSILAEETRGNEINQQLEQWTEQFCTQLSQVGVQASRDEIDYLLSPVTSDDYVSMASAVTNMISVTNELERLTEESKELPSETKKYYGMYLILVACVDRIQTRFVEEIDRVHLPKLQAFQQEARRNIVEAQNLIESDHSKKELAANIEAGKTTIEACQHFAAVLQDRKATISNENSQIKKMLAVATNTYKTIRLSINVAEVIGHCQKAFKSLRCLKVPPLRPFQNLQLKQELQLISERMIESN